MAMQHTISHFDQSKSVEHVAVDDESTKSELLYRALGNPFLLRIPTIMPLTVIAFAAMETSAKDFLLTLVGLQALASVFTSVSAFNVKRVIRKQANTKWPVFAWLMFEAIAGMVWGLMMIPVAQAGSLGAAYTVIYVTITATLTAAGIAAANAQGLAQALLLGFMLIAVPASYYYYSATGLYGLLAVALFPLTVLLVGAMVRRQARNALKVELENENLAVQLAEALQVSQYLSQRDNLTGLLNRSEFRRIALDLHKQRFDAGVTLIAIDLDHFKLINDRHGHAIGDQVLAATAKIMKSQMRTKRAQDGCDEVIARWGGEEFVIALADCSVGDALKIAERLRNAFETYCDVSWPDGLKITGSFGVASWGEESTFDQVLAVADKAMYQAKADGRNAVRSDRAGSNCRPICEDVAM